MNMRFASTLGTTAVLATLVGCVSMVSPSNDKTVVGKVTEVYVETAPGLLVDTRLVTTSGNEHRWARVEFAVFPAGSGLNDATVVQSRLLVEPGDFVRVRLASGAMDDNVSGFAHHKIVAMATQEEFDGANAHQVMAHSLLKAAAASR